MDINPIKTEADYDVALMPRDRLMDAKLNTLEGDCLDMLTSLVEAWEEKRNGPLVPAVSACETDLGN